MRGRRLLGLVIIVGGVAAMGRGLVRLCRTAGKLLQGLGQPGGDFRAGAGTFKDHQIGDISVPVGSADRTVSFPVPEAPRKIVLAPRHSVLAKIKEQ